MTPEEQARVDAVTMKLTGEFHVGATVKTRMGRFATVLRIRDDGVHRWMRVKFGNGGHWEYHSTELQQWNQ